MAMVEIMVEEVIQAVRLVVEALEEEIQVILHLMSQSKIKGADRFETAIKISQSGWTKSDTVVIVNGEDKSMVDGLTATPLASIKTHRFFYHQMKSFLKNCRRIEKAKSIKSNCDRWKQLNAKFSC